MDLDVEDIEPKSWWRSRPGVLTTLAGVLAALTGLIAAIHHAGWLQPARAGEPPAPDVASARPPPAVTAGVDTAALSVPPARESLVLPQLRQVLRGELTYRLHSAVLLHDADGGRRLELRVQLSNNDRVDAKLWSAAFRLRLADVVLAPDNELNEQVPAHGSRMGQLLFRLPPGVQQGELLMGEVGEQAAGVAFHW